MMTKCRNNLTAPTVRIRTISVHSGAGFRELSTAELSTNTTRLALEFLGLESLSASLDSDIEVVEIIERGLPKKCVSRLGLAPLEVARVLHITERALLLWMTRAQARRLMTPLQGSQLWLLGVVIAQAADVLGTERLALDWLRKGQLGLNQRKPLELASTPVGLNEVQRLLNRIEHGVYV